MKLLETLTIYSGSDERRIELYQGDLTALTPDEAVDVLVVSAYPNDYSPTLTSLIGALYRKGVSVAELASRKEVDLRQSFSCWMSPQVVATNPGIQFKRILCFEPLTRGEPPEVVGDIFRALAPFLGGSPPISTVALPLVACGDQGVPVADMLGPLLDAAVHWLSLGLPLKRLKIVAHSERAGMEAAAVFQAIKEQHPAQTTEQDNSPAVSFNYDVFISYSHANSDDAMLLADELHKLRPDLRLFIDRKQLNTGSAWQCEIFEALDACRKVLVVFSPQYLQSKVCKEEFNIAWARSRDAEQSVVFPIYLYSAPLPTYMKLCQYLDCREGNKEMMRAACAALLSDMFGQEQRDC